MSKYYDCCVRLVSDSLTLDDLERISGLKHQSETRWSVGEWIPVLKKRVQATRLVIGSEARDTDPPSVHLRSVLHALPDAACMTALAEQGVRLEIDFAVYSDTYTTSLPVPISDLVTALRDCPLQTEMECSFYPSNSMLGGSSES